MFAFLVKFYFYINFIYNRKIPAKFDLYYTVRIWYWTFYSAIKRIWIFYLLKFYITFTIMTEFSFAMRIIHLFIGEIMNPLFSCPLILFYVEKKNTWPCYWANDSFHYKASGSPFQLAILLGILYIYIYSYLQPSYFSLYYF